MLVPIADQIWHAQHRFSIAGMRLCSRMTVVRLANGRLWLHSPIPLSEAMQAQLRTLGQVAYIVAPSKFHHLFAEQVAAIFPHACLYGAPGLAVKRPDLLNMIELIPGQSQPWDAELGQVLIAGIPLANETWFFHHASRTLIATDFVQWWQGDLPWGARFYGWITGVRQQLAVPRTVRLMMRDKAQVQASINQAMQWPIERVVYAHNGIIDTDAQAALAKAFAVLA